MKPFHTARLLSLIGGLLATSVTCAKDNNWWKEEVYALNDSSQRLKQEVQRLNARMTDTLKSGNQEEIQLIAALRDPLNQLDLKIKAFASILNMAGYSSFEDRSEVIYRLKWQCDDLHLAEPELQEPTIAALIKRMPMKENTIAATAKAHDDAARNAASICRKLKL